MKTLIETRRKVFFASLLLEVAAATFSAAAEGGEVQITSIVPTTIGMRMVWTNSLPGHAYTVQERDSLSVGTWIDAPTRYRWPGLMSHWVESGTPRGRERFYRVKAEPAKTPERGKLLGASLLQTLSLSAIQTTLANYRLPTAQARWPVRVYKLVYETVDPFGLVITASGALCVPQGPTNAMPLLSDQHGTTTLKNAVPSRGNNTLDQLGLFFASSGYVTQMPDYLGLGDSPGFQAYLHARTEATAVVDMLRAVRAFCATNPVNLGSQLFLAGYSQGGHATMAACREIEMFHTNEFTITAAAPMAGPYDYSGVTFDYVLTNRAYPGPALVPFTIAAFLPIYDLGDTFEGLLRAPYDRTLAPLLDGLHTEGQITAAMPADPFAILRPDYLASLRSDPNHPLRLACRDNDLYEWTPTVPMRLYHCRGDTIVPQANATVAFQSFSNAGACCVSLIDPGSPSALDHGPCWPPSVVAAKQWFDGLKQ